MSSFAMEPETGEPDPLAAAAAAAAPIDVGCAPQMGVAPTGGGGAPDPEAARDVAAPWVDGGLWGGISALLGSALRGLGLGGAPEQPRYGVPAPAATGSASDELLGVDDEALRAQLAQADLALADRFQIVDAEAPRAAGNVVTQEEYDQVVKMFAQITAGAGDLKLPPALSYTSEFMQSVNETRAQERALLLNDIASILQTENGRALIGQLNDNVVVDADGNEVHKTTEIAIANNAAGVELGPEWKDKSEDEKKAERMRLLAAGVPSNALATCYPGMDDQGIRSDVAMFHELRHALDITNGTGDERLVDDSEGIPKDVQDPDDASSQPVTLTEYKAVGIGDTYGYDPRTGIPPLTENAYRAERADIGAVGGVGIRGGDIGMEQRSTYKL